MVTHYDLRQKYKKWAHRRDGARKHRRKSRRRKKKKRAKGAGTTTESMLLLLLQQLMMGNVTPAAKHGENVKTGYAGRVSPDALAPVRSRMEHRLRREQRGPAGPGAGAGAAAAAALVAPPAYPAERG
jgi:hypothetical protein